MRSLAGKTVLVTGGALGVGRELVRLAVDDGARVVIWDVREADMQETADAQRARGADVSADRVDLADRRAIEAAADRMLAETGPPEVLANNAGVVNGAPFWEQDPARMEFTLRVNTLAPMLVARAFLPAMLKLPAASLLNVVSAGAHLALPRAIVYTASKWGALGWSEGLTQELREAGIEHVRVTSVLPGPIASGMFEGAAVPKLLGWQAPAAVARAAWRGMKTGRSKVYVPRTLAALPLLRGMLPTPTFYRLCRRTGLLDSMASFKGGRGD